MGFKCAGLDIGGFPGCKVGYRWVSRVQGWLCVGFQSARLDIGGCLGCKVGYRWLSRVQG